MSGRYLTKKQCTALWKETTLPAIKEAYEQDGIPDRPARRESWNNFIDYLLQEGQVRESADNWSHPRIVDPD